jgi:SAM-dependent methyltransferase
MDQNSSLGPLPPGELMSRVSGTDDGAWFTASGKRTVDEWSRALGITGRQFQDFPRILDFGCGCGRALRHLRPRLAANQELIGADVDGEAIDWVARNYPTIRGLTLDLLPPSTLADGSVDLIVNQSVFTHLPEDVHLEWLAELHRVLRLGGIAVLTFHGRQAANGFIADCENKGLLAQRDHFIKRYNRLGFYHVQGRNQFEQQLPEYYGSAFHTIDYIEQYWFPLFRCIAWLPVFSLDHQDVLVLEKNSTGMRFNY